MSPIEVAAFSVGRVVVDVVASGIHGEEVAMPEKPDLMVEEPRSTTTQGGAVLVLGGISSFRNVTGSIRVALDYSST